MLKKNSMNQLTMSTNFIAVAVMHYIYQVIRPPQAGAKGRLRFFPRGGGVIHSAAPPQKPTRYIYRHEKVKTCSATFSYLLNP